MVVVTGALRDDMREALPRLLPKYIALLGDAERSSQYELVPRVLDTLEGLGPVLEEHLPVLLPALVRLMDPGQPPLFAEAPLCGGPLLLSAFTNVQGGICAAG